MADFNPYDWIPKPEAKKQYKPMPKVKSETKIQHDVETIIRRIEAYQLDLTCNYQDWISVCFAFADEFGEAGRSYFHRVSRFYLKYDQAECDRQFDKCLRGRRSGVSIKSFFYLAQGAGISIKV